MILVSNDFPPKVGGIQNYLFELWSRLPLTNTKVITTKYEGDREFDSVLEFEVERYSKILWPTPQLVKHVNLDKLWKSLQNLKTTMSIAKLKVLSMVVEKLESSLP